MDLANARAVLTALALAGLAAPPAAADEAPGLAAWLAQSTATGNWRGYRTKLQDLGVTPALNYTTDLVTNPVGGLDQDAAYAATAHGSVSVDLNRLIGTPGLTLYLAAAWDSGRNLSSEAIGNIFDVQEAFNGNATRLAQAYLLQDFWDGRMSLAAGRLATGDDFAALDSYDYYTSAAVNGNPTSILVNAGSFTTPPFAQWGGRATLRPADALYLSGGAYDADTRELQDRYHGFDLDFDPQNGVLVVGQLGYRPNLGGNAEGLPGHYAIGGYLDSSTYEYVDETERSRDGNYGLYLLAEQTVYREPDGGGHQGLTVWSTLTVAPDQQINTLPFAAYGGLVYTGLLPDRDRDATAFGLAYGRFSDDLPGQSYELALEVNHRFQMADWLYVTPNVQYVANPNGGGIPDAAVFGLEISVDF